MRRDVPADDQVTVVMERVLAQAAENGRRATVTAVERALGIRMPHLTAITCTWSMTSASAPSSKLAPPVRPDR